jgi:hypothetical protein
MVIVIIGQPIRLLPLFGKAGTAEQKTARLQDTVQLCQVNLSVVRLATCIDIPKKYWM